MNQYDVLKRYLHKIEYSENSKEILLLIKIGFL